MIYKHVWCISALRVLSADVIMAGFTLLLILALSGQCISVCMLTCVTADSTIRLVFIVRNALSHCHAMIVIIPKTIGNRKRDCAWGCARGINTTWENLQIEKHKSACERNERLPDLCFSICRFSQVVFIPRVQPHVQCLFLFPIVLGINNTGICSMFHGIHKSEPIQRLFNQCCHPIDHLCNDVM